MARSDINILLVLHAAGLPPPAAEVQISAAAKVDSLGGRGTAHDGNFSKSGSRSAAGSTNRGKQPLLITKPKQNSRSKAGSSERKRKARAAEQQQDPMLELSPELGVTASGEREAPRKQVRFADAAAAGPRIAAAPPHAPGSMHAESPSLAAAAEAQGSPAEKGGFAADEPDMADDGWEVPNTFPLDPNGCELLPGNSHGSPSRPAAIVAEPSTSHLDAPTFQEPRDRHVEETVAVLKPGNKGDQQRSHASESAEDVPASRAVTRAKAGAAQQAGAAKLAKCGRAAPDVAPAVTRGSKRHAPSPPNGDQPLQPNQALQACSRNEAAAQDDDFQETPAKLGGGQKGTRDRLANARLGKDGEIVHQKGRGLGEKAKPGRGDAAQTRWRETAKRQLSKDDGGGTGKKGDGPKLRRKGRLSVKKAAARAAAAAPGTKEVSKQDDVSFFKMFTAEAALQPPAGESPSSKAAAAATAADGDSTAAEDQFLQPSSIDEVPGTASAEAADALAAASPAAAAAKPPSQLPVASTAAGNNPLWRDPDGHSSAATPSEEVCDRALETAILSESRAQQQQQQEEELERQNRRAMEKLEEAEALTVPDTPHADLAPAQRRGARTPLPGPWGTPGVSEKPAEAAASNRAALSVIDINALGARLAQQVGPPYLHSLSHQLLQYCLLVWCLKTGSEADLYCGFSCPGEFGV